MNACEVSSVFICVHLWQIGVGMTSFEPVLLRRILKKADPSLEAYRADGGYRALLKAISEMTPAQIVDVVKSSGLRGRGGALAAH